MSTVTRVFTNDNGQSCLVEAEPSFPSPAYPGWPMLGSSPEQATEISFHRAEPGTDLGWHAAPRRQYIVVLSGEVEVETEDGSQGRFGPGTMFLLEDVTGRGHRTRFVGAQPCTVAVVPLAD